MADALTQEIEEGLRRIQARRRRVFYVFLGYLPFMFAAGLIVQLFSQSETPLFYVALLYFSLFAACGLIVGFSECPRCHGLFHMNWWSNPYTQKCVHCGLSVKISKNGA